MVIFKNTNFIDSEDLIHESLTRTTILNTVLKMYSQETLKEYSFIGGYFNLFNLLSMISKEEKISIIIFETKLEVGIEFYKNSFVTDRHSRDSIKTEIVLYRSCIKDEFVSETKENFYNLINMAIQDLIESNKIFTNPIDPKLLKDHYPPGTPFVVTKVYMNGDKWVKHRFDKTWYLVTKDNLDKEDNILLTVNGYGKLN